jgi:hypothetical protein
MVFTTVMIMRRSTAAGWRLGDDVLQSSSIATSCRLTWRSVAIDLFDAAVVVARDEGVDRELDLLLDEPAHLEDAGPEGFELGIELLRGVFGTHGADSGAVRVRLRRGARW